MDSRWNALNHTGYWLPSLLPKIAALLLPPLVSLAWIWSPAASASVPVTFHIAAGEATLTLNEFSRQSSLQLLFDFRQVRGKRTLPVEGSLEPQDALRRMLTNTGLGFDFVNERTLAVTPIKQASPAGSATPPPQPSSAIHGPHRLNSGVVLADAAGTGLIPGEFEPLDTVNVTGTYFRGATPVGADVISVGRQEIANSGAVTAGQFLQTLSQVFGGGPTQDTHQIGPEAQTNSGFGTGINLRGLGARETLVLIDGRRLAPGGSEASFVDIENIPLSAVDRIDVLPDGESAVYGADAVGGVVNFIMRDHFTGAETELTGGRGTRQSLGSEQFAHSLGKKWDSANAMLTLDYYRADGLPTADRSYAVSDLRPFGGSNFDVTTSNPGTLVVGSTTYALPANQNGTGLSLASLAPGTQNLKDRYLGADLVPQQQRFSLYGFGHASLGEQLGVFSSVLLVDRQGSYLGGGLAYPLVVPASNPFNPARGVPAVLVNYNFLDDLGPVTTDVTVKTTNATAGFDWAIAGSWTLHGYGQYARERELSTTRGIVNSDALATALADSDPSTAFNPFGAGSHTNPDTLRALASGSVFRVDSQLEIADLNADGTLLRLPGGDSRLALGLDHRTQFYETNNPASAISPQYAAHRSREVTAAFAEFVLPLFGKDNARAGLRKLDLSAAIRHEDYSGVGSATTPKFGLAWSPLPSLAVRSTWSRSVRAPTLADLDQSQNIAISQVVPAPMAPGGRALILVWSGKNAALEEERARSWTAGLDFNPVAMPEVSLGLTWFDVAFRDGIETPAFSADLLTNPLYSSLVSRNPDPALVAQICQNSLYFQGSKANCASGVQTVLDLRAHNTASLRTRGIDFAAQYRMGFSSGQLEGRLDGTYLLRYALAEVPNAPAVSLLNTQNNPINLRLRAALGWKGVRFGWVAAVNYTNSYRDVASNAPVAAWTTCDAQVFYELGSEAAGARTRFELNATNLLNRTPPFLNNQIVGIGYDQENADPYGRLINLRIRKSW